jgi:hypothetical protein
VRLSGPNTLRGSGRPPNANARISTWQPAAAFAGVICAGVVLLLARSGVVVAADQPGPTLPLSVIQQYAPLVYLHSDEQYHPAGPEAFLIRSELRWRLGKRSRSSRIVGRASIQAARLGKNCGPQAFGCYRGPGDFSSSQFTRPHDNASQRPAGLGLKAGFYLSPPEDTRAGDQTPPLRTPLYYETSGVKKTRITYWFFYGYSQPEIVKLPRIFRKLTKRVRNAVSHEGDWENIDVILSSDQKPEAVLFYGHGKPKRKAWPEVCKFAGREVCGTAAVGHPIVFSAKGTHASYPNAGKTKVCSKKKILGIRPCSPDRRDKGDQWRTWTVPIADAAAQPWYGFGGAWGDATGSKDTTGPLGPSAYKPLTDPDSSPFDVP